MRTVTAVALRVLVNFTLHCGPECVLRSVLLLARQHALVEELCILTGIESIISHVLTVVRARSATLASVLSLLAGGLVPYAVVVRDGVNRLELHLVDSVIVQVVFIIAHRVALLKVRLGHAAPVLDVNDLSLSIYIVERDALGARVVGVEGRAGCRQGKAQFVEVAG